MILYQFTSTKNIKMSVDQVWQSSDKQLQCDTLKYFNQTAQNSDAKAEEIRKSTFIYTEKKKS